MAGRVRYRVDRVPGRPRPASLSLGRESGAARGAAAAGAGGSDGEPEFLTTRADVRDRFAELLSVMPEIGSVAMLPLTAGDERLGVLAVSFADERALSTADREYLAALGGISALTLARQRR